MATEAAQFCILSLRVTKRIWKVCGHRQVHIHFLSIMIGSHRLFHCLYELLVVSDSVVGCATDTR